MHLNLLTYERYKPDAEKYITPLVNEYDEFFKNHHIDAVSNNWHKNQLWKQVIAYNMYYDLLYIEKDLNILEIGAGVSFIPAILAQRHNYKMIETPTLECDLRMTYRTFENAIKQNFIIKNDWEKYNCLGQKYDIVIANDLFPNVDQRLYMFMYKFFIRTKEMRLSLTYYEDTYFHVKRIGSGEFLTVCPWDTEEINIFLECYKHHIIDYEPAFYYDLQGKIFKNKRNIITVRMK